MNSSRYHLELVSTAEYTTILMEETKGMGKRGLKGLTRDLTLFGGWFSPKKAAEADAYIGAD